MNIQLTISLLVSDRMETLRKCLDSLKPLLRELDSELIAVFTGKNEETLELLQQYTSHIIPFTWCDDFSKARNAGLKEARGNGSYIWMMTNGLRTQRRLSSFLKAENITVISLHSMFNTIIWTSREKAIRIRT